MDAAAEWRCGVAGSCVADPDCLTFGDNVRQAVAESLAVAKSLTSGIVIFGIQAAGILLPLAALFGLPALGVLWLARKRFRRLPATL